MSQAIFVNLILVGILVKNILGEIPSSTGSFPRKVRLGASQLCGLTAAPDEFGRRWIREMGGVPRNLAHGNHLLVWIVKPSGCHSQMGACRAESSPRTNTNRRVPTPLWSTSPFLEWHYLSNATCLIRPHL